MVNIKCFDISSRAWAEICDHYKNYKQPVLSSVLVEWFSQALQRPSATEKLDWNIRNSKVSITTSGLKLSQAVTNSDPLEGFLRAQKGFRGLSRLATETQEKALLLSLYFFETSILTRWKLQVWQ